MARNPFSDIPYTVHTNRELGLMLKGVKPLTRLGEVEGHRDDVMLRYLRMFDRHVEAGRFVRRDVFIDYDDGTRVHTIYFALPGQEWRIDAMIELPARPGRWSRAKEREEGELFGYTDEQNEIWLRDYYDKRSI